VGTVDGPSDRSGAGGNIPYARTLVALAPNHFEEIRAAVGAAFRTAHTEAFAALVDAGAGAVERHRPRHFAVFMGYDFHIGPDGPRLIEINTNAGGALLNGLHTAALCRPERLACACRELLPVDAMEKRLFGTFTAEFAAARPGVALRRVAIADDRPAEQPLRSEFELFRLLFERAGVEASVCDVAQLERVPGGLALAGRALDLVYLRDTDWRLEAPRSRALREAYLADDVLVTPSPREHHLLANKERLALFARADAMQALGASPADAALLASLVPETRRLDELGLEGAWRTRGEWFFKPATAYGSRAVYRGDKISRRKLEEIFALGGFVAQRRVDPGRIEVATDEGPRRMKFDVRAYAYRDEVLLLGARVYEGQVTNLRTPGGGFSAICVVRSDAPGCAPAPPT
jgi:hypothetical protein